MTILYLFDTHGYYVGLCEGIPQHENSTPIKPPDSSPHIRQRFVDGAWVGVSQATETNLIAVDKKVSPAEFKLLFSTAERMAIKSCSDPVVQDFFEIVNDPRLTVLNLELASTRDAIARMESIGIIEPWRAKKILSGVAE